MRHLASAGGPKKHVSDKEVHWLQGICRIFWPKGMLESRERKTDTKVGMVTGKGWRQYNNVAIVLSLGTMPEYAKSVKVANSCNST